MKFHDMIAMSLNSLFKRKVRTLLTVAGVVIGTCAIVVMLSFGIGIKESMNTMMQEMGDLTVIQIYNNSQGIAKGNTVLDDKAIAQISKLPSVVAATPIYSLNPSAITIRSTKYNYSGEIYGVNFAALRNFGYKMERGELPGEKFDQTTVLFGKSALYMFSNTRKRNNNMVSAEPDSSGKIADPYVDPMKDKLELVINEQRKDETDTTATVTSKQKPSKLKCFGILADDWSKNPPPGYCVFMDISYAKELQEKYNKLNKVKTDPNAHKGYDNVCVKVEAVKNVAEVEKSIHDMGFTNTNSMDSIRKPLEERMRTIQLILGGLGAISLLVAALGITNTMIMSIYERTREIGVMKVLGCVVGNIRTMFLIEAGCIGFMGGAVGVILSYCISFGMNSIGMQAMQNSGAMGMAGQATTANISIIPAWLALGALLFATMVGLVSGFYPANRAVQISALTAIKQE